jgi:hypothetical protein
MSDGKEYFDQLTNRLDRQIRPMKLLDWAIRAASLIDVDVCPLD